MPTKKLAEGVAMKKTAKIILLASLFFTLNGPVFAGDMVTIAPFDYPPMFLMKDPKG